MNLGAHLFVVQLNVFISLLWLFDAIEYISQSSLERAKFYAEWNNYSSAARNGVF